MIEVFLELIFRSIESFFIVTSLLLIFGLRWEDIREGELDFFWQCDVSDLTVFLLGDVADNLIPFCFSRRNSCSDFDDWKLIDLCQIAFYIVFCLKFVMTQFIKKFI